MPITRSGVFRAAVVLAAGLSGGLAFAQDGMVFEGEIGTTLRYFPSDGLYVGQDSSGISPIVDGRLSFSNELENGQVVLELSGRYNTRSKEGYADIPRGYFQYFGNGFDVLVGSNIEYWGVSESQQVVDVINQTYNLGNPVDQQSLGQPMINVNVYTGMNSSLSFYALLGFRERDFGDRDTRFRSPLGTNEDFAFFEEESNRHVDFAVRYRTSQNLGNASVDFAVSYFRGTDRDPKMLLGCTNETGGTPVAACNAINTAARAAYEANPNAFTGIPGALVTDADAAAASVISDTGFIPYYQSMQQLGLEFVYARGDLQLTFEGALREAMDENYFSGVIGAQYNFDNARVLGDSLVVIGEYLYDDRSNAQPVTIFDNDIFLGFIYGANDVNGSSLSGGMYFDVDTHSKIYSLKYSRRLSDSVSLDVAGFAIDSDDYTDPVALIDSDGYVELSLRYFF